MRVLIFAIAVAQLAAVAQPLAGAVAYLCTRGTVGDQRRAVWSALAEG